METITKYKAFDGKEFTNKDKCTEYEEQSNLALEVISCIHKAPDSCDFANGSGYIQHEHKDVSIVRNELLELAKFYTDHKWIQQSIDDHSVDTSWAGRIIGEYCNESLNKAWNRISCIDNQLREWGQPYYASHPNMGQQVKLNN